LFVQLGVSDLVGDLPVAPAIAVAAITFLAMLLFYWRIRLPFCMALMAIALLYLFYTIVFTAAPDFAQANLGWVFLLGGLVTIIIAVCYDIRDPERTTRFSDNAFWLHLVSAPLIISGLGLVLGALQLLKRLLGGFELPFSIPIPYLGEEWKIMALIGLLTVIGLALNRRALVASSLCYAAMAIALLVRSSNVANKVAGESGFAAGSVIAITLVILGIAIVFLGVGWHFARGYLLKVLPDWKVFPRTIPN